MRVIFFLGVVFVAAMIVNKISSNGSNCTNRCNQGRNCTCKK